MSRPQFHLIKMFLEYLIRTMALMTAGVIIANIIMETNILAGLDRPVRCLCRISNLPEGCITSVFSCMLSPTAGKSILSEFYRRGEVDETETILTILMSTFPVVLGESLFRIQAPVAIVLLGPVIGGIYVMLNLFSSFLQSFFALVYSKLRRPPTTIPHPSLNENYTERFQLSRDMIIKGFKKSRPTLRRVLPIIVATMILMEILMRLGFLNYTEIAFDPILRLLGLPGECIAPLVMQFIHFSAGYAAVAALLDAGTITEKQAIITLLVGSMAVITMIYIRYSLSMYLSLFGKFGTKIAIISYLSSMTAKVITIFLVVILL